MTLQLGLALRDKAIERTRAANVGWVANVVSWIRLRTRGDTFTTDDLWAVFAHPPEPRAMGAAIKAARVEGLIIAEGVYRKSTRAECHARPVAVWRRR